MVSDTRSEPKRFWENSSAKGGLKGGMFDWLRSKSNSRQARNGEQNQPRINKFLEVRIVRFWGVLLLKTATVELPDFVHLFFSVELVV